MESGGDIASSSCNRHQSTALRIRKTAPLMLLKRTTAVFLAILGLVLTLFAYTSGDIAEHSIQNSLLIEREFQRAAAAVEAFEAAEGRDPDTHEFKAIQPDRGDTLYVVELFTAGFDLCDGNVFDSKDGDTPAYLLTVWRGEWMECYSPKTGQTTLTTNPADYFVTGGLWLDRAVFSALAIASLMLAVKLWKRGATA
jgi:hypothetical protein